MYIRNQIKLVSIRISVLFKKKSEKIIYIKDVKKIDFV